MKKIVRRYIRYIRYLFQWIFKEKIRGLDFSMRDISLLKQTGGVLHGYSKTDESHLKEIFNGLNISSNDSFLDVGCGKGAVLRFAYRYPFSDIRGIDLDSRLITIAEKNFSILKMNDRIRVTATDALKFEEYGNYTVFYFFNPFCEEIFKQVIEKINRDKKGKVTIIYHNPAYYKVIEDQGGVMINKLYDKVKSYNTYIYEL